MKRSAAIALLAAASAAPLGAQTLAPVRIGTSLSDPFLEPYYGVDQGFFANAGVAADDLAVRA